MCTPWATPLEIAPRLQAMAGKGRAVEPGKPGPFLDDEGDRIGVDRIGTNPVAVGYRLPSRPRGHPRWRQTPQSPEQRAVADLGGGEPGFECRDRAEIGLSGRQPHGCAVRLLVVLAPRQEQRDAILVAGQRRDIEPRQFRGPQCRGKADQE